MVLCKDDAKRFTTFDDKFVPSVIYNPLTLKQGKSSNGTSKRFLTIGRFTPLHKGIDLLIEAFNLFSQKNQEWCLDIVGEGKEENTFRDLIVRYHLENRITIHSFTNNIQEYYSNAQIYVLSSRWEGMPNGSWTTDCDIRLTSEQGDYGRFWNVFQEWKHRRSG